MEDKIYYCESCGGVMEFDVATQSLKCPNCDTVVPIVNEESRIVEHSLTHHAMRSIRASEKTSHTMECRGCGARIEVEGSSTAAKCPYCGSDYVLASKQEDAIIPDGVLPFQVDKNRVGELFRRWMKGRWLAPGELKTLYQKDRLQGVYIPYWTFDARANVRYTAMGGRHRTVTRKGADGKEVQEVVTDWYPTSGNFRHFFDDVLVPASDKLDARLLRRVGSFGTQQVASYSPEYFSGYGAECYTVDLEQAHREAAGSMERDLEGMARSDVLRRYDEVSNVCISVEYQDETYKHVLLPVYTTAYTYKGKQYHVFINGQSGKVEGDYPKSPARIAGIVAVILLLLLLLYWFSEGSGMRANAVRTEEIQVSEYEMEVLSPEEFENSETFLAENETEEEQEWDYLADNLPT